MFYGIERGLPRAAGVGGSPGGGQGELSAGKLAQVRKEKY